MRKKMDDSVSLVEGQRFRIFLLEADIKQIEISVALDIKRSTVSKYVSGEVKIPSEVIVYLYKNYNLSFKWFYTGKGNKFDKLPEKKHLVTDVTDLKVEIGLLNAKIDRSVQMIDKVYRDFYAGKVVKP